MKAALVVLIVACTAHPARAQDARDLFRQGVAALREGRYAQAIPLFQRSHTLRPQAATLCNLATAYEGAGGQLVLAAEAYEGCAALDVDGRYGEHARTRAAELRAAQSVVPVASHPPTGNDWGSTAIREPLRTDVPVDPRLPTEPERQHTLLWIGTGAAIASATALVVGIVFMGQAQDDADALDVELGGGNEIVPGSGAHRLYQDAEDHSTTGWVFYGVSGALAALSAVLITVDLTSGEASDASNEALRAAVVPLPDGIAVTARLDL